MLIQQIRNATIIIEYAEKRFLIDPMFVPKNYYPPIPQSFTPHLRWPLVELPFNAEEIIQDIDAVIMTHYHIDHFDEFAANILAKDLKIFVQDDFDKHVLEQKGFKNVEILSMAGTQFEDVILYKVHCLHGIKEKTLPYFTAIGIRHEAMGVVFKHKKEDTLYLAGDTIWCDFVKQAIDKFSPTAVIVNAADARLEKSGSIIMGTEDIMQLHRYAPHLKIIASHMDTVGHATLDRKQLNRFINEHCLQNDVYIPKDGEVITMITKEETMKNKEVAGKFYEYIANRQYDKAEELCHEDFVYYPQVDKCLHGAAAFVALERSNMDSFGDFDMQTKFLIAENDRVAVYLTFEGDLQTEGWHGVKARQKHMYMDFMTMLRFKDGKIIEKRAKYDRYYILKQLDAESFDLK